MRASYNDRPWMHKTEIEMNDLRISGMNLILRKNAKENRLRERGISSCVSLSHSQFIVGIHLELLCIRTITTTMPPTITQKNDDDDDDLHLLLVRLEIP